MSNEENPRLRGPRRSARVKGKKSKQGSKVSISSYIPFVFLMGFVCALVDVKDQFKDHIVNKWICVVAPVIYGVLDATKRMIVDNQKHWASRYSKVIEGFKFLSGSILLVSLFSVFLSVPDHFAWLYVGIWLFLALIVARQFFKFLYAWICQGVNKMFCHLQKVAQSTLPSSKDVLQRCFA